MWSKKQTGYAYMTWSRILEKQEYIWMSQPILVKGDYKGKFPKDLRDVLVT